MTDYKLKGMGCEFDDLISDTAKPKMRKVDLDGMLKHDDDYIGNPEFKRGCNSILNDIKAKYGELYATEGE